MMHSTQNCAGAEAFQVENYTPNAENTVLIVENLYIWFLWGYAIGGPVPGQRPRDISLDAVWGIVAMFIIIAAIGETINWLVEEVKKLRKTKSPDQSVSSKISRGAQRLRRELCFYA